ncbi:MAG: hypothetical protein IV105_00515 [Rhizobacter sp.]|nr:hypothetical protein [Rhizobacter sp.]
MKTSLTFAKALALAAVFAASAATAQTSVGVSVSVNQPGVYGRIDIGNMPPPPVIYAKPIIYAPQPVHVVQQPMYLYVPPGHQKKWGKHCHRYNACGQPVYFVKESWVRERYEHEHRGKGGHGKDKHEKKGKGGKHGND